jgi:hypothetical protein
MLLLYVLPYLIKGHTTKIRLQSIANVINRTSHFRQGEVTSKLSFAITAIKPLASLILAIEPEVLRATVFTLEILC